MKSVLSLILILIFYAYPLAELNFRNELVVWNIGQGQWITSITYDSCLHFDTGGERIPWKKILSSCHGKINKILFSHKDKDHTQRAYELFKKFPKRTCLLTPITTPEYPIHFKKIPHCEDDSDYRNLQKLHPPIHIDKNDTNFHSEVIQFNKFLFAGDSTKKAEKYWVNKLKNQNLINVLVLGHHGSKTSTSIQLLNKLPTLSQCVSSSRKAKYGHPHKEVLARIKAKNCPHLSTEMWGHIHFIY